MVSQLCPASARRVPVDRAQQTGAGLVVAGRWVSEERRLLREHLRTAVTGPCHDTGDDDLAVRPAEVGDDRDDDLTAGEMRWNCACQRGVLRLPGCARCRTVYGPWSHGCDNGCGDRRDRGDCDRPHEWSGATGGHRRRRVRGKALCRTWSMSGHVALGICGAVRSAQPAPQLNRGSAADSLRGLMGSASPAIAGTACSVAY